MSKTDLQRLWMISMLMIITSLQIENFLGGQIEPSIAGYLSNFLGTSGIILMGFLVGATLKFFTPKIKKFIMGSHK